ncbi:MAG: helix-turn-helix domain-containing protein [Anaerolineae bacterium]|nr:helix-turn-helix domain-containing protein [Anaerolineae bacterium]MDW8071780.1 helix-turn-helix transcriptional regulator [Anaerolineae bacterium]
MVGVLLQYARQRAKRTLQEAAEVLGVTPEVIADFEWGRRDISLVELEILAHLYRVPVAYFWSEEIVDTPSDGQIPVKAIIGLRRRIIAVLLQQARLEAGRSREELAQLLDCPPTRIAAYEAAERDIPLVELEAMAQFLGVPMSYFFDQGIQPAGEPLPDMEELRQLAELPADVRRFIIKPGNILYLRAAMQLSALPASTLRRLGESLLDITY